MPYRLLAAALLGSLALAGTAQCGREQSVEIGRAHV